MTRGLRLPAIVGGAALITVVGVFMPVVADLALRVVLTRVEQVILGVAGAFIPSGLAGWWAFGRLQLHYPRREARAAAVALAAFSPLALIISVFVAQIPGSFADIALGPPFGLVGAFVGMVLIVALLSLPVCAGALRLASRGRV